MTLDEFLKHERNSHFEYPAYAPMGMRDDDVMVYTSNGVYRGELINVEMEASIDKPMNRRLLVELKLLASDRIDRAI